jgi:hypothetical protein
MSDYYIDPYAHGGFPAKPASTERISAHGILRDVFVAQVLRMIPSWVRVSDASVLGGLSRARTRRTPNASESSTGST